MALITRQFTALVTGTSGANTGTNAVTHLDDATNIAVIVASSAGGAMYQPWVSFYDPDVTSTKQFGGIVSTSTFLPGFYPLIAQITSSVFSSGALSLMPGTAMVLPGIAYSQLRLLCSGNDTQGTVVGWLVKQINV